MLNDKEKAFARELLAYLETEDLISLTKTTTNDVICPTSRSEAVSAIILHTETLNALLSRKKVTKEVLFKYLHDRQHGVSLSEHKDKLRKRIVQLLGIDDGRKSVSSNAQTESRSDDSGAGSDVSGSEDYDQSDVAHHSSYPQTAGLEVPYVSQNSYLYENHAGATGVEQNSTSSNIAYETSTAIVQNSVGNKVVSTQADFPVDEFSRQFVSWFFNLLNSGGVEEEHFWMDATAEVFLQPGDQVSHGSASSGVSQLLGWVRGQLGLTFNPNMSGNGVRGRSDPHGLMIVHVCGTLHTPDRCVGVFTQQFALARDPYSNNNWKVKNTRAVLRCPGNALDIVTPTLDSENSDLPLLEPP